MTKELDYLKEIAGFGPERETVGLDENDIRHFIDKDARLPAAINSAYQRFNELSRSDETRALLMLDEARQVQSLQEGIVNFYDADSINPYVPLAARGPWIITTKGAVIHDSGGYGMLGFGQNPAFLSSLGKEQVMANIMTASFSQKKMVDALNNEIGHRRGERPNYQYLFLNSGSEANTLSSRISDVNALVQTSKDDKTNARKVKFLSLVGSFHGRTDRPGQVSDSCQKAYKKSLYSYQARDNLMTVNANDIDALEAAFERADKEGVFIESAFIEPVLGEGCPGLAITPAFYQRLRELTDERHILLIVDSVQAGFRATGNLSIVDYPGFEDLPPPDIEVFSKALNGGQYPLSVIALSPKASELYRIGLYGNTMTANPRALDAGLAVLANMTDDIRNNIVSKGDAFLEKLNQLAKRYPSLIKSVQGSGLLFAIEIDIDKADVVGKNGLERQLRKKGIGVIHGGQNALRFTPVFDISEEELQLVITKLDTLLASVH